ncbi:MAG TPA: hypothetical protein VHU87_02965 [Rhizomicrobium sp.]|jgi:hypothetical protein|nr:hypothetical protein [Rhizomicrobium sp.]
MRALVLLGCAATLCAFVTPCFAYPTGSEALEARLLAKMGPAAKAWIAKEGAHEATAHIVSDGAARSAAFQYGATDANLDALSFLVLMQAERDADNAVRGVAVADMTANAVMEDERHAQQGSVLTGNAQRSQLSGGGQLVSSAQGDPLVSLLPATPGSTSAPAAPTRPAAPQGIELQDAMDRESQLDDLVTAAMAKLPPAQESLVMAMP